MAILTKGGGRFRAVIFDLDETLLLRSPAWCYAVEESVLTVTGRRVTAAPLSSEYRARPWRAALSVLLDSEADVERCGALCQSMFERSALKRLLIHDGLGMALDGIRGERIEIGAISRERHAQALKQVQSTGLDRFLAVLSATPPEAPWDVPERLLHCLSFLERGAAECAFVAGDGEDLEAARELGFTCYQAAWAMPAASACPQIAHPSGLAALLAAAG
ncbi:MAG: HAD family hydrolase [Dehalococcoidia bacterium]